MRAGQSERGAILIRCFALGKQGLKRNGRVCMNERTDGGRRGETLDLPLLPFPFMTPSYLIRAILLSLQHGSSSRNTQPGKTRYHQGPALARTPTAPQDGSGTPFMDRTHV
jgi:hypothetical protein